jgi:hypothetical protein
MVEGPRDEMVKRLAAGVADAVKKELGDPDPPGRQHRPRRRPSVSSAAARNPIPSSSRSSVSRPGADSIVAHLREDRRHIQDHDVARLQKRLKDPSQPGDGPLERRRRVALRVRPKQVTLVPEKRQELTTEGGLDVIRQFEKVRAAVRKFHDRGIEVSLFIDPTVGQVSAAARTGSDDRGVPHRVLRERREEEPRASPPRRRLPHGAPRRA